jgi:hypothetical protein
MLCHRDIRTFFSLLSVLQIATPLKWTFFFPDLNRSGSNKRFFFNQYIEGKKIEESLNKKNCSVQKTYQEIINKLGNLFARYSQSLDNHLEKEADDNNNLLNNSAYKKISRMKVCMIYLQIYMQPL